MDADKRGWKCHCLLPVLAAPVRSFEVRGYGLNPKSETLRKDALCIKWSGRNGEEGKVASAFGGIQAAIRRTHEDRDNVRALARELDVQQKLLYTWKYQFEGRPDPRHAKLAP